MKETTNLEKYAAKIVIGIILIFFTIFGFFVNPTETEVLWDKLHPFSIADFIGVILFYGGSAFLAGFFKPVFNPENSSKWNLITFAGLVLSIVLIWNL